MFRVLVASMVIFSLSANSVLLLGSDDRHNVDAVKTFMRNPHGRHVGRAVQDLLEEGYAPYIAPPGLPGVRGERATPSQVLQAVYEETIAPRLTHTTPAPQRVEAILLNAKLFAMRGFVPHGVELGTHLVRVQTLLARLTPGGLLQIPAEDIQIGYAHLYRGILKVDLFNHGIYKGGIPLHPDYAAAWQEAERAKAYTRSKLIPLLQADLISEHGFMPSNEAGDGVMTEPEAAHYARELYAEFESAHEEERAPVGHRGAALGAGLRLYHPGTKRNSEPGAEGALRVWHVLRERTRAAVEGLPMADDMVDDMNEQEEAHGAEEGQAMEVDPLLQDAPDQVALGSPVHNMAPPFPALLLAGEEGRHMHEDGDAALRQQPMPSPGLGEGREGEEERGEKRHAPEMMEDSADEENESFARMRRERCAKRQHLKRRVILSDDEEEAEEEAEERFPLKRGNRSATPPSMVLSRSVAMKNAAGEEGGDHEEEEGDEVQVGRWGQSDAYDVIRERIRAHVFAEHDRRKGKWSLSVISQWLLETHHEEMASMSLVGEDKDTVTRRRRFCTKLFASHAAMGRTVMTHEAYMEGILAPCLSAMKEFGQHNDKTAPEVREFLLENYRGILREAGVLTEGLSPREEARKIDSFIRHRFDHEGYPHLKVSSQPAARLPQVQAARKPLTDILYALYNGEVDGVEALTSEPQLRAYLLAHHRDQLEAAGLLPEARISSDDEMDDENESASASAAAPPSEDATALVSFIHKKFSLKGAPGKLTNAHYDASAEDREVVNSMILRLCDAGNRSQPEIVDALMRNHHSILRRLPRLWKDGQLDRKRVVGVVRQFFISHEAKQAEISPKSVRAPYTEEERRRLVRFIEANEGEEYHRIAQRWNRRYPDERIHSAQSIGHFKRTYMRPTKPRSKK